MIRKIVYFALGLTLFSQVAMASSGRLGGAGTGTPAYLSVPGFKQCLGSMDYNGASLYCLPAVKPDECLGSSWATLQTQKISPCTAAADGDMGNATGTVVSPGASALVPVGSPGE